MLKEVVWVLESCGEPAWSRYCKLEINENELQMSAVLAVLGVGFATLRSNRTQADYLIGGRKLNPWLLLQWA